MEKTDLNLRSNWQDTRIELMKTLHGYQLTNVNEKEGIIDYVTQNENEEKQLLRVIVDGEFQANAATLDTITKTLEDVEEGECDEAIIVADRLTKASKRLIRKNDNLNYISQKNEHFSFLDILEAVQSKTKELCEAICGQFPNNVMDCTGYEKGGYMCQVRRVSDDIDFHSDMGWTKLLKNDFSKLVKIQRGLN